MLHKIVKRKIASTKQAKADAITGAVTDRGSLQGADFEDEILAGPATSAEENKQAQQQATGSQLPPIQPPTSPASSGSKLSNSLPGSEAALLPGISTPALDKLCFERSAERSLLSGHDIGVVFTRVSRAFDNFTRIVSELAASASSPSPSASQEGGASPDFVDEVIVSGNEPVAHNDVSVTNGSRENNWTENLLGIQKELEQASTNATLITASPAQSSNFDAKSVLEGFAHFGEVLAKATTQFGDMVSKYVSPEVRRISRNKRKHRSQTLQN